MVRPCGDSDPAVPPGVLGRGGLSFWELLWLHLAAGIPLPRGAKSICEPEAEMLIMSLIIIIYYYYYY